MKEPLVVLTHPACLAHDTGRGHPESPARLTAVLEGVRSFAREHAIAVEEAPLASRDAILRVHAASYLAWLEEQIPEQGIIWLDADTALSANSHEAIYRAAGAVERAVQEVLADERNRAFCAVRPPGHHAEPSHAMGFSYLNNLAIGAASALAAGIERLAVIDFDVHHGNGTEAVFGGDDRVLICSLFQHPLYPGSGLQPPRNGVFVPVPPGTDGAAYREIFAEQVEPRVAEFAPELIMVSCGFDAHAGDPLAGLELEDEDYARLTERIVALAEASGEGRVVSTLEGGYRLEALRGATMAHLAGLWGSADASTESSAG